LLPSCFLPEIQSLLTHRLRRPPTRAALASLPCRQTELEGRRTMVLLPRRVWYTVGPFPGIGLHCCVLRRHRHVGPSSPLSVQPRVVGTGVARNYFKIAISVVQTIHTTIDKQTFLMRIVGVGDNSRVLYSFLSMEIELND